MKVVILAGGLGTRLSEETQLRPKPMVEIGDKPILWHIMKIYAEHGFKEFVICLGYKGYMIKEYFLNYHIHQSDISVNLNSGDVKIHKSASEDWDVTLVDTGAATMTGGRIKRIQRYVQDGTFLLTYGDGVGDINIKNLVQEHHKKGKLLTVTGVQPSGRFGLLRIDQDGLVSSFQEKPVGDGGWSNGGFFVCEPGIFDYIPDQADQVVWEKEPLEELASAHQMNVYKHGGFWKPMDTQRDKKEMEDLWTEGVAPWKIWK
ncbi:MAG TPA: glucose-1-phosphate cytidylyltransferase [Cyclobacteriaceae bacterium]|nr:glucose-1-phosphate cytidylyltransferase [Cyclobacteriaceae bacterium]